MPSIQYSWDAPATDSQFGPADHYLWQHRKVGDPWTRPTQVNGTSITIPNLERDTEYEFRVKAVNFVGESADVSTTVMTTSDLPAAVRPPNPTNIQVRAADSEITVSWTDPGETGTDFSVRYRRGTTGDWTQIDSIAQPEHTIIDLDNGGTYQLQVRSSNYAGASAWSATQTATPNVPFLPPAKILFLNVEAFQASVRVSWDAPNDGLRGAVAALTYDFQYRLFGDSEWTDQNVPSNRIVNVTNVATESTYEFRARAVNAVGAAPWSEIFTGRPSEANRPQISFSDTPLFMSGVTFTQDTDGVWHGITEDDDTSSLGLQLLIDPVASSGRNVTLQLNLESGDETRLKRWEDIIGLRFSGSVGRGPTSIVFPNISGQFRFRESEPVGYVEEPTIFEARIYQADNYYTRAPNTVLFSVADNDKFKPVSRGFINRRDGYWARRLASLNKFNDGDDFKIPILREHWALQSDGDFEPTGDDVPASAWKIELIDDWWVEAELFQRIDSRGNTINYRRWLYDRLTEDRGEAGISSAVLIDTQSSTRTGALLTLTRDDDRTTYNRYFARGSATRNEMDFSINRGFLTINPSRVSVESFKVFNNRARGNIVFLERSSSIPAFDGPAGQSVGQTVTAPVDTPDWDEPLFYLSPNAIASTLMSASPHSILGIQRDAAGTWALAGTLPAPDGGGAWPNRWTASTAPPNLGGSEGDVQFDLSSGDVYVRGRFGWTRAYNASDYGFGGTGRWQAWFGTSGLPGSTIGDPGDWAVSFGGPANMSVLVALKSQAQTEQQALDMFDTYCPVGHEYIVYGYEDGDTDRFPSRVKITRTA